MNSYIPIYAPRIKIFFRINSVNEIEIQKIYINDNEIDEWLQSILFNDHEIEWMHEIHLFLKERMVTY